MLRTLPTVFEMLPPILGPGSAKVIDKSLIGGNELSRPAIGSIHDRTLYATFNKCISRFPIVGTIPANPWCHDVQRPDESFRVIERRVDCNSVAIPARREDLDHLQLIAVFEHRVRHCPGNDVSGPGHKRVSVPESNRLPVPLRNLLHMPAPDENLSKKVVGNAAQELHLIGCNDDLDVIY